MSLSNPLPAYLQQFELNNNIRTMGSMFPIHLQQPVSQSTFSVLQSNYQGNYSQLSANLLQSQFDLEGMYKVCLLDEKLSRPKCLLI